MRAGFGVLGLLLALAIVGLLAKKQLTATKVPAMPVPVSAGAAPADAANGLSTRQQSQPLQQQVQQSLDKSLNTRRPEPDDSP